MPALPQALLALGVGNYRRYVLAQVFANASMWMHRTAHVWLVVQLSGGDPVAVGVVTALQYVPMIPLSLGGGALGDRFDKRRLLLLTQGVVLLASALLAILVHRDLVTLGPAYVFAVLLGIPAALDAPVRLSFPRQLVPRALLAPAVAVNGGVFQLARVVGPALAGGLIALGGTALAFAVVAAFALAASLSLARVRRIPDGDEDVDARDDGPPERALSVVRRPPYLVPLLGGLAVGIGITNVQLVVPLIVADQAGAAGGAFGVLLAAIGLGGVTGAVAASSLRAAPTNRLLVLAALGFTTVTLVFATVPAGWPMAVSLFLAGAMMQLYGTMAISALQLRSPARLQSRMMSYYVIAFFVWTPFGSPAFGRLVDLMGPRQALGQVAVVCLALTGWMALLSRARRVRTATGVTGGS